MSDAQAVIQDRTPALLEENIFQTFLFYFLAAAESPDGVLLMRNQLFHRLVACWQGRRLGLPRLEQRFLQVTSRPIQEPVFNQQSPNFLTFKESKN
jgi:hypothetical protein